MLTCVCVCVCVWRLCLAPSSPHSPSGKLRAGTVLLFIPLSHTPLAITIYRHAATGKVRVDLPAFISPWWHEWNALNSVCCLIPDLLKRRTAVVLQMKRGGQQTKRKQDTNSRQWYYTLIPIALGVSPRTLCLKHPGWFTLEAGCYFYKQVKI